MMNKRFCKGCGKEINPKRLEILPKTQVCVECSSTEKKQALTIQLGEGDHTYNEIVILDPQSIREYEDSRDIFEKDDEAELLNFENDDLKTPYGFNEDYDYKQPVEAPEDGPDSE